MGAAESHNNPELPSSDILDCTAGQETGPGNSLRGMAVPPSHPHLEWELLPRQCLSEPDA